MTPSSCLTDLRFCCAANVLTASEAREPDAYRDCSNRLLDGGLGSCETSESTTYGPSGRALPAPRDSFHVPSGC